MPRNSGRHRRLPVPRTLASLVGVAALVTAVVGAADAAQEQQETSPVASAAALEAPAAATSTVREQQARRAEVMDEASRGYTRTALDDTDASRTAATERGADRRTGELAAVAEVVAERDAAIERELARQQRFEEQRERIRKRRLANRWVVPVSHYEISATFGSGGSLWSSAHTGLDFAAAEGTPVMSTAAGEVTSTGYDGAYGNQVVITHDDGTQTWYCHLSSIYVSPGESVEAGTEIGAVGSTGNTTGPHLHLEVRPGGGSPVDPYSYLQEQGAL